MDDVENLQSEHLELLAEVGFSGHMGGLRATEELAAACHIGEGDWVLDVGTGTGQTPKQLSTELGCRVVGIDVSPKMVKSAREVALESESDGMAQFIVGDGTQLPFKTGCFDAVIGESILAFLDDKSSALAEFRRVVKSGGYVGVNEVTWLETPAEMDIQPHDELVGAEFETVEGWKNHFENTGFTDMFADVHRTDFTSLFVDELRRQGAAEMMAAGIQFAENLVTDEQFREFVRAGLSAYEEVAAVFENLGYGIYVGRNP